MPNPPLSDDDAVAAADKEMEERANRAKALLSNRYKGLKTAQVNNLSLWLSCLISMAFFFFISICLLLKGIVFNGSSPFFFLKITS